MTQSFAFTTELEVWEYLYASGDASRQERRSIWKHFNSMFPEGHSYSLRDHANHYADKLDRGKVGAKQHEAYLTGFHPDALRFLARHGRDYKPSDWKHRTPQESELQPQSEQCLINSVLLAKLMEQRPDIKPLIVEGLSVGPRVPPIDHVWLTKSLTSTLATDWTLYAVSKWTRYLGFPLTQEECDRCYRLITPSGTTAHLLFDLEYFPIVRETLEEIAANR